MNIVFYIGIVLLVFSLFFPIIFRYTWKEFNTAGKFWTIYMGTLIGIILILIGALI